MTIETDINDALTGYAGLTALVGTDIYLGPLPSAASFPAIRYSWVANRAIQNVVERDGLARAVWQYDIWAVTSAEIQTIRVQLIAAIEAATTFSSVLQNIQSGIPENNENLRRLIIDYSHWFNM